MSGERSRSGRGQHFLASPRLAAELVASAGVGRRDLVLEIGAGDGLLTRALAARAGAVQAIERDPRLLARARRRLSSAANVALLEGDALGMALPTADFRVVANLPFGITTAVLRRLLEPEVPLRRADLVVQWELARKRVRRRPSTLLAVGWAPWYELSLGRRLPPDCFRPPPSVSAGVLVVRRRPRPLVPVAERARYLAFVQSGFRRADQPLGRVLRRRVPGLGGATAVDLDGLQWAELYMAVQEVGEYPGGR